MEWTIIDLKLIDAYTILCLAKDDGIKEISDLLELVQVPDKYHKEVSIKIANRRIEVLSQAEQTTE